MATTSIRKQKDKLRKTKDKYGNRWYRDIEGNWYNEHYVKFTPKEHRNFGRLIAKANKEISKYMEKYPYSETLKSKDIGSRYRNPDLSHFRRRSSYKRYLAVTKRIISGSQLYVRLPEQYQANFIKGLSSDNIKRLSKMSPRISELVNQAKFSLRLLSNSQLIRLSRLDLTPQINSYYSPIEKNIIADLEQLIRVIDNMIMSKG